MRQKIFKKFYLTTSVISLAGIAVLMMCLSLFVRNYMEREKKELLLENDSMISSFATQWMGDEGFEYDVSTIMRLSGNSVDAVFFITDAQGNVISCGCREWNEKTVCLHSVTPVDSAVMKTAMTQNYYRFGYLGDKTDSISYITATPINNRFGGVSGAVFGISPSYTMRALMSNMYKVFGFSLIIPVAVLFVALYIMTLRLTKPMRMMSEAAKSISKGDFSKRIPVWGDDEITELSVSFNNMTDSLSRLESMRRSFIANVSHELRTPMTTIGGFIDGMLDGTIEKDQQAYYMQIISDEVKRLTRLVQSMLNLAKLESGEMQPVREDFDVSKVLFDVVIAQEQRIEQRKLSIQGLDEIGPHVISADRDLIHQVIYNLVDNAVKFAGEGGYISFYIGTDEKGQCVFKIRNSGQGIAEADLPYVFERFYKTDKSRSTNKESSGLGLYLVRTIISIHGGTVTVRSTPGQYTEFEFCLPGKTPQLPSTTERR